jgi:hypothetical protein
MIGVFPARRKNGGQYRAICETVAWRLAANSQLEFNAKARGKRRMTSADRWRQPNRDTQEHGQKRSNLRDFASWRLCVNVFCMGAA